MEVVPNLIHCTEFLLAIFDVASLGTGCVFGCKIVPKDTKSEPVCSVLGNSEKEHSKCGVGDVGGK